MLAARSPTASRRFHRARAVDAHYPQKAVETPAATGAFKLRKRVLDKANSRIMASSASTQAGSKRWTYFHSALQLAIQRSAHKWT